jgi:RNAse (barnase) inhibitor barstar
MAWKVALVLDTNLSVHDLDLLARQMPIWAVITNERVIAAKEIRDGADALWAPEPSFTLFQTGAVSEPVDLSLAILEAVELHHAQVACLELFGIESSERLLNGLHLRDFVPAENSMDDRLVFRKPIEKMENVPELSLDASGWRNADDLFNSFFDAVGAPAWHGKNFDALNDSIVTGDINAREVPYVLRIQKLKRASASAQKAALKFTELLDHFEREGCPVSVRIVD